MACCDPWLEDVDMARSKLEDGSAPNRRAVLTAALGATALTAIGATRAFARAPVRNVVLVHGA
jgi:hypothetical protein